MTSWLIRGGIWLLMLAGVTTSAQVIPPGETVANRPRPWVEPRGIRYGLFSFFPRIGVEARYDDNIFAREQAIDDFIALIRPRLEIRSGWSNHALGFTAQAELGRYADNPAENYDDYSLSSDGRFDISRSSLVEASLGHSQSHLDRGSPDEVNGIGPTIFRSYEFEAGLQHSFNRLRLRASGGLEYLDFDDVFAAGGAINNDDRDRYIARAQVRASYNFHDTYEPFAQLRFIHRDYSDARDDDGFDRDSIGIELAVGSRFDLTGVTFGELFFGYLMEDFSDSRFDSVSGVALGGELTWTPTGLTTLEFGIDRTVESTILTGASSSVTTAARLRVDHELLRTLILSGELSYSAESFDGIDRDDVFFKGSLGARYLVNRHLYLTMRYEHRQRDSDGSNRGRDFSRGVLWLRVETQI